MAWPEDDLGIVLEIAPGADLTADPDTYAWQSILPDWQAAEPLQWSTGSADEAGEGESSMMFVIDNTPTGRYTSDNVESDLWPFIDVGLPIRLSLNAGTAAGTVVRTVQYLTSIVDDWPAGTPMLCQAHVDAAGLFTRLNQAKKAAKTALRRTALGANAAPISAAWLMEEGQDATRAVDLTGTQPDLVYDAGTQAAGADGLPGTAGLTAFDVEVGVRLATSAKLTIASANDVWFWFVARGIPADPPGIHSVTLFDVKTSGVTAVTDGVVFYKSFKIVATLDPTAPANTGVQVTGSYTSALAAAGDAYSIFDGDAHTVGVHFEQSGFNIASELWIDGVLADTDLISGSPDPPTNFVGPTGNSGSLSGTINNAGVSVGLGGLIVSTDATFGDLYQAANGWQGEYAHARVVRLCNEEGVPVAAATATTSARMGAQPADALMPVLRDVEKTDRGILDDTLGRARYRALSQLYNQTAGLIVDGAGGELVMPWDPTRDDQKRKNKITASRPTGGEATYTDATDVALAGEYEDQIDANVQTDGMLLNCASWAVHEGVAPGKRHPSFGLDLHQQPLAGLAGAWLAVRLGDRSTVRNPPRQAAKGDVDSVWRGFTETIAGRRVWSVTANMSPYWPYEAYTIAGAGNRGRLDNRTSTLAAALPDPTATSVSVASSGVLWVTGTVNFDLDIGGERMTVTNISGASSPQTFTVTRSVNGVRKVHNAGIPVRLWWPGAIAL